MVVVLLNMLLQLKNWNALSNLLNSYNKKFEYSANTGYYNRINSWNPYFIGGSNNLDSNLIKISNKKFFAKEVLKRIFVYTFKKGNFWNTKS